MTTFLEFALLGLGTGAVYVMLASGVILVYKGSGVLNFAQGAMAMVGGYVYYELTYNHGWAPALAIVAGALVPAAIGVLMYALVMRKITASSTLIKLIATLALFITLESAGQLLWGQTEVQVPSVLPTSTFSIGSLVSQVDQPLLLGIAVVLTLLLWAGFRFTATGLATRALSENRRGTAALGWSEHRLAILNWGLAGLLGGLAGALIGPISGLQVASSSLLVIPAMAAALIGGFTSFPIALVGAVVLGIAQSEASNYLNSVTGLSDALPFIVIVAYLVIRGKTIPLRGVLSERMPAIGSGRIRWRIVIPIVAVVVAVMFTTFSVDLLGATTTSLEYVVLMLSIVVLTGYAGQVSLATLTFGGVAALIAARLIATQGWSLAPAAIIGLLAMIPVGVLFGVPALRTRGANLAVVTLGLSTAVSEVVFNNGNWTGVDGTTVGVPHLFGLNVDSFAHPQRWMLVVIVCLLITIAAIGNVRRGRVGRRLIALRDNERAAMSLGVNVVEGKLYAFVLAGLIAGLGGLLLGFQNEAIQFGSPSVFDPFGNVLILVYAVLGGVGFLLGPFYGGILFVVGGTVSYLLGLVFSSSVSEYVSVIGGVGLMAMLTVHPDGMFTLHVRGMKAIGRRVAGLLPDLSRDDSAELLPLSAARHVPLTSP